MKVAISESGIKQTRLDVAVVGAIYIAHQLLLMAFFMVLLMVKYRLLSVKQIILYL
jgi:hypothetical protein